MNRGHGDIYTLRSAFSTSISVFNLRLPHPNLQPYQHLHCGIPSCSLPHLSEDTPTLYTSLDSFCRLPLLCNTIYYYDTLFYFVGRSSDKPKSELTRTA
jgi:hypothetical protein